VSHNSADNSNRSEPEDSSLAANAHFSHAHHSATTHSSLSSTQRAPLTMSTHSTNVTEAPKVAAAAPKLNSYTTAHNPNASSPDFSVCWAIVNRGPWWPGKVRFRTSQESIPERQFVSAISKIGDLNDQ
jgi:hypothetical protein